METGDVLGIIGLCFGAGSIIFCVFITWLFDLEMHVIMAMLLGLFFLLAYIFFTVLSGAGLVLCIIGIAKSRSKISIAGFPLSIVSFLWLLIPILLYYFTPS